MKEFYINVEVDAKVNDHDLACTLEKAIDQVEPQSGYLGSTISEDGDSQSLCFTMTPPDHADDELIIEDVKKEIEDSLVSQQIKGSVEITEQ